MNESKITPPPELVQQWMKDFCCDSEVRITNADWYLVAKAAQWGADQELEACCEWLRAKHYIDPDFVDELRAARRPKPPSLKQQVLATLQYPKDLWSEDEVDAIRRLVDQLDD